MESINIQVGDIRAIMAIKTLFIFELVQNGIKLNNSFHLNCLRMMNPIFMFYKSMQDYSPLPYTNFGRNSAFVHGATELINIIAFILRQQFLH
jgi:hypothetical protein